MEKAFSPMNPDLATKIKDKTTILYVSGERIVTRFGQELSQAAIDELVCETIMAE